ncbi:MAG: acyltransferase [Gelidibacter sp.]
MLIKLAKHISYFLSFLFNYRLIRCFVFFKNLIYSQVVKRQFLTCGNNIYVESPIFLIGGKSIKIGKDFYCFKRLRIEAYEKHNGHLFSPEINIGDNVSINYDCHIGCINKITIGDNVLIASRVFITDHYHGESDDLKELMVAPNKRKLVSKGPVVIENNVWIGEGVAIMPNVTIGENSIIGANAVVTKSFPPNSVIGGVPAKLIKTIS